MYNLNLHLSKVTFYKISNICPKNKQGSHSWKTKTTYKLSKPHIEMQVITGKFY